MDPVCFRPHLLSCLRVCVYYTITGRCRSNLFVSETVLMVDPIHKRIQARSGQCMGRVPEPLQPLPWVSLPWNPAWVSPEFTVSIFPSPAQFTLRIPRGFSTVVTRGVCSSPTSRRSPARAARELDSLRRALAPSLPPAACSLGDGFRDGSVATF